MSKHKNHKGSMNKPMPMMGMAKMDKKMVKNMTAHMKKMGK